MAVVALHQVARPSNRQAAQYGQKEIAHIHPTLWRLDDLFFRAELRSGWLTESHVGSGVKVGVAVGTRVGVGVEVGVGVGTAVGVKVGVGVEVGTGVSVGVGTTVAMVAGLVALDDHRQRVGRLGRIADHRDA